MNHCFLPPLDAMAKLKNVIPSRLILKFNPWNDKCMFKLFFRTYWHDGTLRLNCHRLSDYFTICFRR